MDLCPCGSGKEYEKCCGIYHKGIVPAPTAEALMRARYSAYVKSEIDFIVNSNEANDDEVSREATEDWAKNSEWMGLEIVKKAKGGESDTTGIVEFKAFYMRDRARYTHHERAEFVKKDANWFFKDCVMINEPATRDPGKVGRNDPCPCGSGKKYKKCCG